MISRSWVIIVLKCILSAGDSFKENNYEREWGEGGKRKGEGRGERGRERERERERKPFESF